jgi:hypothetical protein
MRSKCDYSAGEGIWGGCGGEQALLSNLLSRQSRGALPVGFDILLSLVVGKNKVSPYTLLQNKENVQLISLFHSG